MRAILVLAMKDLQLLLRDRGAAFFTFVFPVGIALFFGYVFSGSSSEPLQVAAWVEEPSPAAERLVRSLGEDGGFELTVAESREKGEDLVRRGRASALIVVPKGYAAGLDNVFAGGGARLDLVVDPSRKAEGAMLVGKMHEVAFRTVFTSFSEPQQLDRVLDNAEKKLQEAKLGLTEQLAFRTVFGAVRSLSAGAKETPAPDAGASAASPDAAAPAPKSAGSALSGWQPVTVKMTELPLRRGVPTNSFAISFMQGIAWALFGAVLSFSSSMAEERERGTLVRLQVSPMTPAGILAGKTLACFITCFATQWVLVAIGVAFFKVEVSSWPLLALTSAVTAFAFAGIMMLLAASFRTQGAAQGAGRAILLMLAMVGGGTVPVVFMPAFLRTASSVSPFKWALMANEGATWRGWTIGVAEMQLSLGVLLAIGVIGLGSGLMMMRRAGARA
ncbi:MAG: ABC transporter permease [Phycisphaerales bacterium]